VPRPPARYEPRAIVPDAVLSPVHNQAGYEPARLDVMIQGYLRVCERAVAQAEALGPLVEQAIGLLAETPVADTKEDVRERASDATLLFERTTKASLNLVKAADELTRLRSFLAGGPDSRPDISAMGEHELRQMIVEFAKSLPSPAAASVAAPLEP
jgi:Ser/Thr protein kinase RdoA (MazF antagonist)